MLDVHEKGTEAAAVNVIEFTALSRPIHPPPTIKFNNPFLVLIADKSTHSFLFMGKVVNPTEK